MKDYTEIFSKAVELSSGYDIDKICDIINTVGDKLLWKYVHGRLVINESAFLNNGDFSFYDKRFELILQRIEAGEHYYIDAENFMFSDIHTNW